MNLFETENISALQAKEKAQWIAFAPFVFQATRVLRNSGILKLVEENPEGLTQAQIELHIVLPSYGIRVLLEAALGMGLLTRKDDVYKITKTSWFILHDELTTVNMDFVHDVCYQGIFFLEESIRNQKPEGLKAFGDWKTIYEGLSKLPPPVQKSWFAFDHYYSDHAFPEVLIQVFQNKPQMLLDIGGNTGKWAMQCCAYDKDVQVTIMDLPGQVNMAKDRIAENGFSYRVNFCESNLLDETQTFPAGFDAIWMSQFLDCFSDEQIISILKRCVKALTPGGKVFILEPFWDRQRFAASAFSLQQTSLYFTALANGNSQMYHSGNFIRFIETAGLRVVHQHDNLGVSHTLLTCEAT